jgi:CDP-diglyceride synthetase
MGGLVNKKIWTGAVIVPPLVILIIWGPSFILSVMVFAATVLGLNEFYKLALPESKKAERLVGIGLGLILTALLAFGNLDLTPLFLVLILLILTVLFMGTSQDLVSTIAHIDLLWDPLYRVSSLSCLPGPKPGEWKTMGPLSDYYGLGG